MDFARKQLEKYGWTDGKGLGKNENGISQALKPKLKRSVAGIGYDAASDFTEHWWSALYDKAAKNVEVEEKNGKTKKIKTKDEFEITNSTWKIHKKKKDEPAEQEYSDFFVRTDILTGGKAKTKKVTKDSDSKEEPKDPMKLTDEELFAACEGRTAHKGARHGLKALGKLARIEQQEQMLLKQAKFKGYSQVKDTDSNEADTQVFEESNLNTDYDSGAVNKKKKKKKRCISFTRNMDTGDNNAYVEDAKDKKKSKQKKNSTLEEGSLLGSNFACNMHEENAETSKKKSNHCNVNVESENKDSVLDKTGQKKKKRKNVDRDDGDSNATENNSYHSSKKCK
ncbi:G patch domain-containing protein 4 [Aricia agestis]|uniref:G patch domain-containing protein 4 n=1 Tax=Aricia agestis TaxID=91739 RepID=UPI001C2048EB|nr:G patch domain-containing protein 4 [Aricia agestis]